jgi:hypothetical protein
MHTKFVSHMYGVVIIQRKKTKLIWILSTTLFITFIFGGIISMVILQKYRLNALVLHEIQQGMYKFMSTIIFIHSFMIIFVA